MVNKIPYTHLQKLVRRYFRPIQRALDVYNNGINKKFVDDLIEFYKSKTQKDIAEDLLEVEILNRLNKENISSQELEELIVELQNDAVRSSIFEQNKRANIKKFETEENEDKKYGLLLAILLLGGYSSSVDKLKDKYTVNQAFNKLKTVEPKTLPPTPAEYESAIISGIREKMYNFDATSKKKLVSLIKNGITEGLNSDEILAMVKKANVNESRASTIVRTELSIINNEISYKVAINSGISYWQWSCNGPAEDVPCREACGEIVSVGSMFPNGLTRPPVHANCMCGVDYVTDARTLRSAGIDTSQEEINARYRPNIYK